MVPGRPLFRCTAAAFARALRSLRFFEIWLIAMLAAMHLLFLASGQGLMGWTYKYSFLAFASLPPKILVGMALIAAWEGARNRSWQAVVRCLHAWREWAWLGLTLRFYLALILTTQIYMWLKLYIPLINHRLYDAQIWRLEEKIFFGYSPNLFLLQLFRDPWVLQAVDWSYQRVFQAGLYASVIFLIALPSNRIRTACVTSYVVLWTVGGWLHVLIPTMGPCYWFSSAWDPYSGWLQESASTQAALLKNYKEITIYRFSAQLQVNPLYGIAAVPSMHNASQALLAFWAMRWNRPAGLLVWSTVVLIFFGSVITGWHYLLDSVAGILLAWGAFALARQWFLGRPDAPAGPLSPP